MYANRLSVPGRVPLAIYSIQCHHWIKSHDKSKAIKQLNFAQHSFLVFRLDNFLIRSNMLRSLQKFHLGNYELSSVVTFTALSILPALPYFPYPLPSVLQSAPRIPSYSAGRRSYHRNGDSFHLRQRKLPFPCRPTDRDEAFQADLPGC